VLDENQPLEYQPIAWRRDERAMVLHRFAVDPSVRGNRIAHQVEEFACDHVKSMGFNYLRTDTNSANSVMQGFLERRNFQKTGSLFFTKCDNPFFCYDKVLSD
jgi:GNAT superfamily N-acetyltransferase